MGDNDITQAHTTDPTWMEADALSRTDVFLHGDPAFPDPPDPVYMLTMLVREANKLYADALDDEYEAGQRLLGLQVMREQVRMRVLVCMAMLRKERELT